MDFMMDTIGPFVCVIGIEILSLVWLTGVT